MMKTVVKFTLVFAGLSALGFADAPLPKCLPCGKKIVSSNTVSHATARPAVR